MLKDPLCKQPTPYDVLEVDQEAGIEEIREAWKKAMLARKHPTDEVQRAFKSVSQAENRALVDILLYNPRWLPQVTGAGDDQLALGVRQKTAQAWTTILASRFPDLVLIHSLALLWYRWAEYESGQHLALLEALQKAGQPIDGISKKEALLVKIAEVEQCGYTPKQGSPCAKKNCKWHLDCSYSSPELAALWQKGAAYMTILVSNPSYWVDWVGVEEGVAKGPVVELNALLDAQMKRLRDGFAKLSAEAFAEQMSQVMLDYTTECRTASLMTGLQITYKNQKSFSLGCGKLVLAEARQLDVVRAGVAAALGQGGGGAKFLSSLKDLTGLLSPYSNISQSLLGRRWDQALKLIKALPAADRQSSEVQAMKTQALIGLGLEELELNEDTKGLKHLKEALQQEHADPALAEEAVGQIEEAVLKRVAALEKNQAENAVELLDKVLEFMPNNKQLELRLSTLLLSEAIRLVNQTQQEINNEDRAPTQSDVKKVERGVEMVKRAKALGNPQAAEQLTTAEEILKTLKTVVVAGKAHKLREKALAAAEKQDWATAVAALEEALSSLPQDAPADFRRQLEKDLKTCKENAKGSEVGKNLQEIMNLREQAANCAQAEDWSGAISRLERALAMIPSGAPADFRKVVSKELATCLTNAAVVGLNAALSSGSPYQMQTALSEAHAKLTRADSLDPHNSHIQTQLRQVQDIMRRAGVAGSTPSYRPSRSSSGGSSTAGYDIVVFLLGAGSVLLSAFGVQGCLTYGTAVGGGLLAIVALRAHQAGFFTKLGFGLALLGLVLAIF